MQFAFKKHHSTVLCTAILLETVSYFKERNSNVYSCLLDATKAFDRINHGKLFRLLLQRGMPPLIVRFLINCYGNQSISVSWNKHRSESFGCLNGVKQGGVLSPILFTVYIDELLMKLRSSGFGCYIDDTFVGALGYADDVTLMSPSIRGLKQMVHICETFAAEYNIKFNEKKTVAILFGKGESPECYLKLNGQPVTWVREVKHLGNIVTSDLTDARDCARKRSFFIGSVNKLLGSYGKIQSNVLCKLFQIYCCSFYGSELWCCNSYGFNRCVIEWNKAMRRILRIPYRSHRWLLAQLGQQKNLREHLHIQFLRYITYALNHCNPIVKKFSE